MYGKNMCYIFFFMFVFVSCKEYEKIPEETVSKIYVVSTTTMLTDVAKEIGKDKVYVVGLMNEGIDPHLYEAGARSVIELQNAKLLIYNAIHLEGKMTEIFENLENSGKKIISAENILNKDVLIKIDTNIYDPHIWFDVQNWKEVAKGIAKEFSNLDPENSPYYEGNLENYLSELDDLEKYIFKRAAELPKEKRILITAHDAFAYFAKAYDFKVLSLQGISTDAETGAMNIKELADFIVENDIKAIFPESSVSPKSIEALDEAVTSRNKTITIAAELFSDSLKGSYIETFKYNIDTIVDSLK